MSVHFLASALDRWDDAAAGALVLTFFSDERPLRGAAGLADWRLCGRLSRLIKRGKIRGKRGETLLMPPGQRMGFPRIMLFGLGSSQKFDEDLFRQHVRWIRDVLGRAGVTSYAVQPPGRATGLIAARRALELWLEEMDKDGLEDEDVAIIDAPGAQKEMAEILRRAQGRKVPKRKPKGTVEPKEAVATPPVPAPATKPAPAAKPASAAKKPAVPAAPAATSVSDKGAAVPAASDKASARASSPPGANGDAGATRKPTVDDAWD